MPDSGRRVIFFDGHCGLCNGFVDFLIARDPKAVLYFAPLQGETAAELVPGDAVPNPPPDDPAAPGPAPRSIVFLDRGTVLRRSDAVLHAMPLLGGVWKLAAILRIIPRALRDLVYDFIARRRYRWFGKRKTCRVPAPAERDRFLP